MEPTSPVPSSFWRALVREPLLHFVLLGGIIFAVDHFAAARQDDPHVIVVDLEVEQQLRSIFRGAQGRDPTPSELKVLRDRWIDNEVLYREGLALRLEQGDAALRERVIFKALNVIESNLRVPKADTAALEAWFEQHRAQYDIPARFDFSEAVMTGATSEAGMQRFVTALNSGGQADVQSGLRVFSGRPRETIIASFGPEFVNALDQAPLDTWRLLPSASGPRVVRLEARTPGAAASFEEVRRDVRQDWLDAKAQALRTSAVRELGKKYTIKFSGTQS